MQQVTLGWRRECVLSKDLPFPRAAGGRVPTAGGHVRLTQQVPEAGGNGVERGSDKGQAGGRQFLLVSSSCCGQPGVQAMEPAGG